MPPTELEKSVAQMGALEVPLIVMDLIVSEISSPKIFTLVRSLLPRAASVQEGGVRAANGAGADLGYDHRLVAMICYMHRVAHYVVFCRGLSEDDRWLFFNDLPGMTSGAARELTGWTSVARECARFELCPRVLLYESPSSARKAIRQNPQRRALSELFTGGGLQDAGSSASRCFWGAAACFEGWVVWHPL
mmetsp:Transcript_115079/g.365622  ORF Transcript_115079/g.365622 Transcript_115079/m.365622 type:complete len:191 (+) Transcript_115079:200-772(+)